MALKKETTPQIKFITYRQAAAILTLNEGTLRDRTNTAAKAAQMGLTIVDLNAGLPKGCPLLKDHIRLIESEVKAIVERALAASGDELQHYRDVVRRGVHGRR